MRKMLVLPLLAGLITSSAMAYNPLYNIDFSDMPVSAAPKVSVTPESISGILLGNPKVVDQIGGLEKALLFNTKDTATDREQVILHVKDVAEKFYFSVDIYSEKLKNSDNQLSILFDTPEIYSVNFHGMGFIHAYTPEKGSRTIGKITDNHIQRLEIEIDMAAQQWQVYINSVSVYKNRFSAIQLQSVRLYLSPWKDDAQDTEQTQVAVDNIQLITGSYEPELLQSAKTMNHF